MKVLKTVLLDIEWRAMDKCSSLSSGNSVCMKALSFACPQVRDFLVIYPSRHTVVITMFHLKDSRFTKVVRGSFWSFASNLDHLEMLGFI